MRPPPVSSCESSSRDESGGRWRGVAWAAVLVFTTGGGWTTPARAQEEGATEAPAATAAPAVTLDLKALLDLDYTVVESDTAAADPGFGLRRVRLITQGTLGGRVGYRVLLEPSGLALGPAGAAPFRGVPLVEAAVEYRAAPTATLRFGQQRLPYGLAASTGAPSLPTPEFPRATHLLVQRVSIFRDIGLSVFGRAAGLEYGVGVFNGAGINVAADNNRVRDVLGRVSYAVRPGWTLGISGWRGRSGALYAPDGVPRRTFYDDASFRRWGVDTRLARGPLHLAAEYLHDRTEHNPDAVSATPAGRSVERSGWYLLAAFRLVPRLEVVGRYDRWDPDRAVAADETTEYVGGIQWYLLEAPVLEDSRLGRALNYARRHSRIMLFAEHLDAEASHSVTILRLRWQLFY